jgi:hypothetical protein
LGIKEKNRKMNELTTEIISAKILEIRGQKVIVDRDLAELYQVKTKVLNQAVKRNIERFPSEKYMFQLTKDEFEELWSQIVTANISSKSRTLPNIEDTFKIQQRLDTNSQNQKITQLSEQVGAVTKIMKEFQNNNLIIKRPEDGGGVG